MPPPQYHHHQKWPLLCPAGCPGESALHPQPGAGVGLGIQHISQGGRAARPQSGPSQIE